MIMLFFIKDVIKNRVKAKRLEDYQDRILRAFTISFLI